MVKEYDDLDKRYVHGWELGLVVIIGTIVLMLVIVGVKLGADEQLRDLQRRVGQLEERVK